MNESLFNMKDVFDQTKECLKPEYFLSCVLHQSTQLLNYNVTKLDLKHTDNIIEKFKFFSKTSESPSDKINKNNNENENEKQNS